MHFTVKLFRLFRIITSIRSVYPDKILIKDNFFATSSRNMAQKSITSFFTITPKKSVAVKDKDAEKVIVDIKDVETLPEVTTPVAKLANGKEKVLTIQPSLEKSSKRQRVESNVTEAPKSPAKAPSPSPDRKSSKRLRVESSGSDTSKSPAKSPSPSFDKKKKIKRQRIESSESETESSKAELSSPDIKVEKSDKAKTYQSPKSRKSKASNDTPPLTEKKNFLNSPKNPVTVKKELLSPPAVKSEKEVVNKKTKSPVSKKVVSKKTTIPATEKDNGDSKNKESNQNGKTNIVDEMEYNPAKSKYDPIHDACWSAGEAVPYLALAKTLEAIEATSGRLRMVDTLSNYLQSVMALTPEDLLPSIYMCLNQLAPAYHSVELGIAETYLMKAVGGCTGRTVAQLRAAVAKDGDLGAAAARARATQRTMFAQPKLTARKVFNALKEIAHMTGHSSVNKKIAKIQSLFTACRNCEAKYLVRSLEGKLRIGLAEQSLLQALAHAATLSPAIPAIPTAATTARAAKDLPADELKALVDANALIIKSTYCECPNYERLVPALLQCGVAGLRARCRLAPGVPLKPMLAHPARGVAELFTRFSDVDFTCEYKYDGERAQIHVPALEDGSGPDYAKAAVFSRSQEDNTSKYPDIVRRLPQLLKEGVSSCVLDCEAVAYDPAAKQILPFQVLSTRKRKGVAESEVVVQVCVFVFDALYLSGRALVAQPLEERRRLLFENFNEVEGAWQFATHQDCSNPEQVQEVLQAAVAGSCEGLMVKALSGAKAGYDIARRSHNWLKLKKDYMEGVGDTVDAVVIGGYHGRGKRKGLYGGFLLACRHHDDYQSLCKIGTGFSDEDLQTLSAALQEHVIPAPRSYYRYDSSHTPDVWFAAARVWEVRCADLSLSPTHRAAHGLLGAAGVSLRFPRFVREREDKTPEQATSAEQIAQMYLSQDQVKNAPKRPAADAEDAFY